MTKPGRVLAQAEWSGDDDILPQGWPVDILAIDPEFGDVSARTACWVRHRPEHGCPLYRSCDLADLNLTDEDFNRLTTGTIGE